MVESLLVETPRERGGEMEGKREGKGRAEKH